MRVALILLAVVGTLAAVGFIWHTVDVIRLARSRKWDRY